MKRGEFFNLLSKDHVNAETQHFIEASKLTYANRLDFGLQASAIMQTPFYMNQIIRHSIELGNTEKIDLSKYQNSKAKKLQDIFKKRKSIRSFKRFLEVKELAVWLSHSYFQYQNEKNDKYENVNSSRSIASGGALYPIELYFINLNVQNLARGVYLYDDKNLNLQKIQDADIFPEALDRAFYFNLRKDWQVKDISGILVFVHVAHRISFKYGSRGLRLAMFDVGALCQNLYLLAGQMENLACCANAGYLDDELNDLLGLVAGQEESLLTLIVGGM